MILMICDSPALRSTGFSAYPLGALTNWCSMGDAEDSKESVFIWRMMNHTHTRMYIEYGGMLYIYIHAA